MDAASRIVVACNLSVAQPTANAKIGKAGRAKSRKLMANVGPKLYHIIRFLSLKLPVTT